MRVAASFVTGGLFGLGLLISGMVDTTKVQGWLDVFGDWDPTLAFVLTGAILPMAVAWQVGRSVMAGRSVSGAPIPQPARTELDRPLVIGSVLFGAGWGLSGLCPGPAMASVGFGGFGGAVFLLSMIAGMLAAVPLKRRVAVLGAA